MVVIAGVAVRGDGGRRGGAIGNGDQLVEVVVAFEEMVRGMDTDLEEIRLAPFAEIETQGERREAPPSSSTRIM
ncbi:unnamed protein product [Urochloa humidicola]